MAYTATPDQALIVRILDGQGCPPRWVVDAGAIDNDVHEPCVNDCDHGPAVVYGLARRTDDPDGFCLGCAITGITSAHEDPHRTGDTLSPDVLRNPAAKAA